jgi:hypothetical protein
LGGPRFKSEFISGAREVYSKATSRPNMPALQAYVDDLFGRSVPLTLTPESTKQEVVDTLRDLLQREREPSCCIGTKAAFTQTQIDTLPPAAYDAHLTRDAGPFNVAQDAAFMASLGLHIDDARLTALTGDDTMVLKGLMDVLHQEARVGNTQVQGYMADKYPLNADDVVLRSQIVGLVPSLKSPVPAGLSIESEIGALRSATGEHAALATRLADCLEGLMRPDRDPPLALLFRTEENIQTIKKMAASVLAMPVVFKEVCKGNISDADIVADLTLHNVDRFVGIVDQLVRGCELADRRIAHDFPGARLITMTGSDMHEGQSVHILTDGEGVKHVYKPRNIGVDMAVCGDGGMFAALNGLCPDVLKLPIMAFDPHRDDSGEYGYTQFVDNSAQSIVMNETEANNFYRQLGQLVVACMSLGVADIHQDNIMAGIAVGADKKPYIIDAEVAFLPHKIMTEDAASLEFTKDRHISSAISNNAIISGEDIRHLRSHIPLQSGSVHAQAYSHSFQQGALEMQSALGLADAPAAILGKLEELKPSLHHIRFVPLATSEFEGARTALTPENSGVVSAGLLAALRESFGSSGIEMIGETVPHIGERLIRDLGTGNIPIMHYNAARNEVLYHNVVIGRYDGERENITPLVGGKVAAIAAMTPETLFGIV